MSNSIFRNRLINNIEAAIKESTNATDVKHAGLVGRIRELAAEKIFSPMLPAGFEIGTGKICDSDNQQSAEIDLVIYTRSILPPIMYSNRDGFFPIESSYYALEIKSKANATTIKDAILKGKSIIKLTYQGKESKKSINSAPTVFTFFSFDSDLTEDTSELERYSRYDPDWQTDPVIKVICIVGSGYWYWHRDTKSQGWIYHPPTENHDEIIDFVAGIANTIINNPFLSRATPFGNYLIEQRTTDYIKTEKS